MKTDYIIRKLTTETDIFEIAYKLENIEKRCFSSPWSYNSFISSLESKNTDFFVAEYFASQEIVGFCAIIHIIDECEILNICVVSEHRKNGIAKALLISALDDAKSSGAIHFYLEVRASNTSAKALYYSVGFSDIGIRKNYYSAPVENAVIMSFDCMALHKPYTSNNL